MITEYKTTILGWEILSFDKNDKVYVKEKFIHEDGILCNNFYVVLDRDNKMAIIYEGKEPKKKNNDLILAKVYLEPTDAFGVITEHY